MDEFGTLTRADTLVIERDLPGPIERVWSYLTDPNMRGAWLARGPMDLSIGGRVELVFDNAKLSSKDDAPPAKYAEYACATSLVGQITVCEPPRLLGFTWGEGADGDASEVRFELSPRGDRVHLVLTHRRLNSRDEILSVAGGWHTHLDILLARLAGTEPESFWRMHTKLEAEYARRLPAS